MREIVLLKISGADKPGILHGISGVLAEYDLPVLDVGQAVIHGILSLALIVEIPPRFGSAPIFKDLLYKANELDVKLSFAPVTEEAHEAWVASQNRTRHLVTVLGREITAAQIHSISGVLAESGMNIDSIQRLSERVTASHAENGRGCVEFTVIGSPGDHASLRRQFMDISRELHVDIAIQKDTIFRRHRRLIAFDMDSTLIAAEVIDELAKAAGVADEVSAITESAMRGELDFKQSLRRRVALLKGLDQSAMEEVAGTVPLTEGAERLIRTLKMLGYRIAILSGGFTYVGRRLQTKLGVDYVYANELEVVDGKLTGELVGDIVDGERKAALLRDIASRENISLLQTVAVGDGANDLPMLGVAGLGIAFRAKPVVKEGAEQAISTLGLDGILYLLGVRDRDALGEGPAD
jgi:phosphoserine phosphatase